MSSVPTYPQILTNRDWQRHKGVLAKFFKRATGVGDLLDKLDREWQRVDWQIFDPTLPGTRQLPRTSRELDERRRLANASRGVVQRIHDKADQLGKELRQLVTEQGWARSHLIPRSTRDHVERDMVRAAETLAVGLKSMNEAPFDVLQKKIDEEAAALKPLLEEAATDLAQRQGMLPLVREWHSAMQAFDRKMDEYVGWVTRYHGEARVHASQHNTMEVNRSIDVVERYKD
jgi:hypothetical protein